MRLFFPLVLGFYLPVFFVVVFLFCVFLCVVFFSLRAHSSVFQACFFFCIQEIPMKLSEDSKVREMLLYF